MVEGKCLKCNHRAPKCDKARRRASLMAPAFYENYETPKTLGKLFFKLKCFIDSLYQYEIHNHALAVIAPLRAVSLF